MAKRMPNPEVTPDDVAGEEPDLFDLLDFRDHAARQRQQQEERAEETAFRARVTKDAVLYRTSRNAVGPGLVICRAHLLELRAFKFGGGPLHVRAIGPREWLRSLTPPACGMCEASVSEGRVCYRDECATPLHPQWPAVYCSDKCALEDR